MKIIIQWLLLSVTVFLTAYFLPGMTISPIWVSLIVGACLVFINLIIKPIINIFTFPINFLTLGLFSLVINLVLFYLLSKIINGFSLANLETILYGGIIVSLAGWLFSRLLKTDNE